MNSTMGESRFNARTLSLRRSLSLIGVLATGFSVQSPVYAQRQQTPDPPPAVTHPHAVPTSAKSSRKQPAMAPKEEAATATEAPPQFPTDAAANPAVVNLRDGKLTIDANNSDLQQILQNFAKISGTSIKGLNNGPRVFGVYGPGSARDVLKDLLVGSGYNFIMVGDGAQGAPRELLLSPQNKNSITTVPVNPPTPSSEDGDEPDQPQLEISPPPEPLGPGAMVPAPSPNSQEDENVRVQQTIQRLQHMQEQQQPKPPQ